MKLFRCFFGQRRFRWRLVPHLLGGGLQVADSRRHVEAFLGLPDNKANAISEIVPVDGLSHEVISAGVQALGDRVAVARCSYQDHRRVCRRRVALQTAA